MTHAIITTGPDGSPIYNPEGGPEEQARRELVAAFRRARQLNGSGRPARSAADALATARQRLAEHDSARARYMKAAEAREAHESMGGGKEALAELREAEDSARKAAARASSACSFYGGGRYGPGTWQGGENAPEHARRNYSWGSIASAMHNGKRGELYALHAENDSSDAVRDIRDAHDCARFDHTGYYDNPFGESFRDGSGLCMGVVGQLRGRNGRAVYVAGYRFGGCDDSGTFDMRELHIAEGPEECHAEDARRDAAYAADSMAERAAELEREYQTAWQAGLEWRDLANDIEATRKKTLALLKENRESGGSRDLPAIHAMIRDSVCKARKSIAKARKRMAELAAGDASELYFYPGEPRLMDAFCEGAELDTMPGDTT